MEGVQKEINAIKERNRRVEAGIIFILLDNHTPLFNVFIPTVGYILLTLSFPFVKNWWLKIQLNIRINRFAVTKL